jgi:hypothetical protein
VNASDGQPITTNEWIDRLAPLASTVLAIGTCTTYGGIPAMKGNPTGAMGLPDFLGWRWQTRQGLPIVCLPGCPVQPDNATEVLLYLILYVAGMAPEPKLGDRLRPDWLFGRTTREGCSRAGFTEQGRFATEYGNDQRCLVKLGCKGPVVKCNVSQRGWIGGLAGCPNVALVELDRAHGHVERDHPLAHLPGREPVPRPRHQGDAAGSVAGRLVPERLPGRHREHHRAYFQDAKARPMGGGLELYGRRRDASEFPVEMSLSPLETDEGLLISSAICDITSRKRDEALLRDLADRDARTDPDTAKRVADELLATIRDQSLVLGGRRIRLSVSIGVAGFEKGSVATKDVMVSADLALYAAKEAGRNRVCMYEPHRDEARSNVTRMSWSKRIRAGLDQGLLVPYRQPIVKLRHRTVAKYELLARLLDERGNPTLPGAFMPTAERTGMVRDVDRLMVT